MPQQFALGLIALASAGCSKAEPTRDELLARANDHVSAREYDKAEKEYREVLRLNAGRSRRNPSVGHALSR
jgi:hypothetical protein